MSVLWTSDAAAAATGGQATAPFQATGVSIDTRSLQPGDLFVALKDARDGHDFVAEAFAKGAAAALVDHAPDGVAGPFLIVQNVLTALEALGAEARNRSGAKVVAVTGSVGKTGAKEMLRTILAPQGRVHAAEKSFNNHWGVPLTLARMPQDTDFAVIEIGMNHPGEISPLSRLARPDVAVITTVAPVHMAAFRNEAEVAFAKAEIFDGLTPGGVAILNRDNAHFARLARRARRRGVARIERFGAAPRSTARLLDVKVRAGGTTVRARIHGRTVIYKLGSPGRHLAMNSLAVLLAAEALGADPARAQIALAGWMAPAGRGARFNVWIGETEEDGAISLIDESYNANPTSMRAALDVLAAAAVTDDKGRRTRGRRVAFLGDMLELGADEIAGHAGLAAHPAMADITRVHTCGPLMKALHGALPARMRGEWVKTSADLAQIAPRLLDAGDVAMVKGSLGSRMVHVVERIKAMGRAEAVTPAPEAEDG